MRILEQRIRTGSGGGSLNPKKTLNLTLILFFISVMLYQNNFDIVVMDI